MRMKIIRTAAMLMMVVVVVLGFAIHVSALDDTFRFDDLELSIKFPKSFNVITINSARRDEAFAAVGLDYDETITAFRAANIYLRAYDPDKIYQISMTVTSDENTESVNNYADLTAAERKAILDSFLADESVTAAVEVKRNGNIFIDSESQTTVNGKAVYVNMINTVVNGNQIDLSMQKAEEPISAEEAKVLSNAAASLSFDNIRRNTGPIFDWWRLLLWVVILAALSFGISFVYRQYNASKKRKIEEYRMSRRSVSAAENVDDDEEHEGHEPAHAEEQPPISFEESLGYKDDEEFNDRADADEMASYDIKVRDNDPNKGIAFFEDEGAGIDDGSDYFDTYFEEPTERRSWYRRLFSAVGSYIRIALTHTGYFFKNLLNKIFKRD